MKQTIKKRGQKIAKRWEKFSKRASEDSREHIQENLIGRLPNAQRVRLLILEWCLLVTIIISLALTQAFWYDQSYSTQAFVDGGTFIEGTVGKINSLNPLFATSSSEEVLSKLLFARLTTVDYSGHIGVGLAESVTPDDTGKSWTLKLKEDLKWSDGEPITIADVIYTLSVIKDTSVNTIYTSDFADITAKASEDSIIFTLPNAYVDFPSVLDIPILPAHILSEVAPSMLLEHSFSTSPITSGAFTFNATQNMSNDNEKIVYLTSNPNYYKGSSMLSSFAVHTYDNANEIIDALIRGEVTATAELTASDREKLPSDLIYEKQTSISDGVFAFLNTSSAVLSDAAMRRAIRQGIDTKSLLGVADGDKPLEYPILKSEIELNNYPEIPPYDFEAAKAYIASQGGDKTIQLATTNTGSFPEIAQNLADQLTKLGFVVETNIYTPGQDYFLNVVRPRSYDILISQIGLGADPDIFTYYHSSRATASGANLSNYRNLVVDDLIVSARATMNEPLRVIKYESFLRHWVEDVPAIGLYQASLTYFCNRNARAFSEDNRLVFTTDRFSDVNYWAVNQAKKNRTP